MVWEKARNTSNHDFGGYQATYTEEILNRKRRSQGKIVVDGGVARSVRASPAREGVTSPKLRGLRHDNKYCCTPKPLQSFQKLSYLSSMQRYLIPGKIVPIREPHALIARHAHTKATNQQADMHMVTKLGNSRITKRRPLRNSNINNILQHRTT
ncbi:unnamed protein product [Ectocarpus sp. 8 AP-2014]